MLVAASGCIRAKLGRHLAVTFFVFRFAHPKPPFGVVSP